MLGEAIYGSNDKGNTHDDGVEEYRPDVVSKGSVIERIWRLQNDPDVKHGKKRY